MSAEIEERDERLLSALRQAGVDLAVVPGEQGPRLRVRGEVPAALRNELVERAEQLKRVMELHVKQRPPKARVHGDAAGEQTPPARMPAAEPAAPLAVRELAGFPARLIAELPLATTAIAETVVALPALPTSSDQRLPAGMRLVLTTSAEVARRAAALRLPCLSGQELRVLAVGVEQDRCSWADLPRWVARKRRDAGYEVTTGEVFSGLSTAARAAVRPAGSPLGAVLRVLCLRLVAVAAGAEDGLALLGSAGAGGIGGEAPPEAEQQGGQRPSEGGERQREEVAGG